jgi:hypothetical protein
MTDLIAGIDQTAPDVLAATMVRSPDATAAERRQRDREAARVLAGRSPREPLFTAIGEHVGRRRGASGGRAGAGALYRFGWKMYNP